MARGVVQKPRDLDYSKVGTAGRRTGITLKEGQRDEHGMEAVDGLFSSPEKSPAKLNEFEDDDESTGSEGMSMDEGYAPDPTDFLNGANQSRNSLLPQSTRSPAKRFASSIRRSPVLRSSPEQEDDLLSPSPSEGKSLLAAQNDSRQDPAPLANRSVNAGAANSNNNARRNTKAQQVAPEPDTIPDFSDGEGDENGDSFVPMPNESDDGFNDGNETVMPEDVEPEQSEHESNASEDESSQPAQKSRQPAKATTAKPAKKAPAPKKSKADQNGKQPARQARPGKSRRPVEEEEEDTEPRPPKKRKTAEPQRPRPSVEDLDPELKRVVDNYTEKSGPLKGRSLYILKKEDPNDTTSTHTRSGRASIRPLAYWRNERCVYGDGEAAEGRRYPLSTIKEVVRTEEVAPDQKKKGKRSNRKGKSRKRRDDSSDEEDEDIDLWEKEGFLNGYVPKWDPKTQTTGEDEALDIAYAPAGIQTREVKDSTFRFAKLLSSSFIGSGVVELPPDGIKKPKNSKKMHMVFYVCHGRVQVSISEVQFSAGKGSVFQVPRGNYYSFANPYGKDARLFFTQGCVPGEGEDAPPPETTTSGHETEAEADGGPSASGKGRGRRKGKQKAGK
ncbi:hypothetical protein N7492_009309 [Penicillium capsulatum]|uniref:CENP-C homolog n=1 Tax=Penicillium capsulatum TaxID=69766 RepID=A0A9W9LGR2_9EURO|nr:hypothetical protein N7492_009309 [Penicillium capsulatum]